MARAKIRESLSLRGNLLCHRRCYNHHHRHHHPLQPCDVFIHVIAHRLGFRFLSVSTATEESLRSFLRERARDTEWNFEKIRESLELSTEKPVLCTRKNYEFERSSDGYRMILSRPLLDPLAWEFHQLWIVLLVFQIAISVSHHEFETRRNITRLCKLTISLVSVLISEWRFI